ncbi:MAG: hypothetical protein GVY32_02990 [Gammaproteobacteria bacterium]|jgi:glycosyltransferase involved in cell wall biosynthesis|nr:hypothetical protein [Gammaproteobacteria bacterium]
MYLSDGVDVLIADDAGQFAEAVIRAYHDEALWTRLREGGLGNVERHFSYRAAGEAVAGLLETLGLR